MPTWRTQRVRCRRVRRLARRTIRFATRHRRGVRLIRAEPKTFASKHVRGDVRSSSSPSRPVLRDPSRDGKATGRHRPSGAGRPACCACRAADQEAGHIHSSRCRSTRPDEAWAMRQPDEPVANFCGLRTKGSEARFVRPSPPLIAGRWWCHRRRWWSKTGSNRRPHACKARALPTELLPRGGGREGRHAPGWWAWEDSNFRPHAYQARALTN